MRALNERIKELRKALGLTQEAFGKQVGLTQNYIWMVEKGERTLGDRTVDDICNMYNVNRQWLETGEGDMYKPLTTQIEIEQFFKAINNTDETDAGQRFRKALIAELARIPPDKWTDIAEAADRLLKDFKA